MELGDPHTASKFLKIVGYKAGFLNIMGNISYLFHWLFTFRRFTYIVIIEEEIRNL